MPDAHGANGLWGLFISAFISSTLAPGGSEILLAYLLINSSLSPYHLLAVATLGNSLGAITTWGLGYFGAARLVQADVSGKKYRRALTLSRRYGVAALLFSWLPVIGDTLCFAAGWIRLSFAHCVLAITVGKLLRYAAIVFLSGCSGSGAIS